jgi:hypothetical protein
MPRKAKLNEDQVHQIRSSEASNKDLARQFGTTGTTISAVRNGKGAYSRYGKAEVNAGNNEAGAGNEDVQTNTNEPATSQAASIFNRIFTT